MVTEGNGRSHDETLGVEGGGGGMTPTCGDGTARKEKQTPFLSHPPPSSGER